jgi:4-diphosphocytidyl-2-C-methyl-D-erythritol kinase
MTVDKGFAPAKANLSLHVTGMRNDGYHLLDSVVVFADVGDEITATPASELTLQVSGPFAQGVPVDERNLVIRAARALREARGVTAGAALKLVKNLPHAAGLGGGSSDAAATLRVLADLWGVKPLRGAHPVVRALGADVPVCMEAPVPVRMQGVGEVLRPLPALPSCGMILVNPKVEVATPAVFKALIGKVNPPMPDMPSDLTLPQFVEWMGQTRNDLGPPAESIAPEVTAVLARLRRTPGVLFAVMSGSGATCVGITKDLAAARSAARAIQLNDMGWWVVPAAMLGTQGR